MRILGTGGDARHQGDRAAGHGVAADVFRCGGRIVPGASRTGSRSRGSVLEAEGNASFVEKFDKNGEHFNADEKQEGVTEAKLIGLP